MKKFISTILAVSMLTLGMPLTTGCSTASTVNEINVILTEATNVLTVADPSAPWVPQLQQAIAALKTAEANWVSGGPVADVDDVLNTIVAITAVIPLTATYSPLIDVLVAGIEVILGALPGGQTVVAAPSAASAHVAAVSNPHIGAVIIKHHTFGNRSKEFVDQWNSTAAANNLPGAKIQPA